ncbi:hypothetical protein [Nocardia sp. NPDC058705]|uniref:hypothetical protein n=1 Tax=Nocardia sp. NPDC058705 TaxID=3346609 RepID=UPI00369D7825
MELADDPVLAAAAAFGHAPAVQPGVPGWTAPRVRRSASSVVTGTEPSAAAGIVVSGVGVSVRAAVDRVPELAGPPPVCEVSAAGFGFSVALG